MSTQLRQLADTIDRLSMSPHGDQLIAIKGGRGQLLTGQSPAAVLAAAAERFGLPRGVAGGGLPCVISDLRPIGGG